jgi:hypothetical protein
MPIITNDMRVITAPGDYYLAYDIAHFDGQVGLTIAADHVTINLNGHAFGNNGPAAIYSSGHYDVEVANGEVWGSSFYGVRLEGYVSMNRVSGLDVHGQTTVGISVEGYGYTSIDNNDVHDIGNASIDRAYGIIAGGDGVVVTGNNVWAMRGVNEAVHYSDTGINHQVTNNYFSSLGSHGDIYFAWLNAASDDLWRNTFDGRYSDDDFGIYSQSVDTTSIQNIIYDVPQDDFYLLPDAVKPLDIFLFV